MRTLSSYIEELFSIAAYGKIPVKSDFTVFSGMDDSDFWIVTEEFDLNNQSTLFETYKEEMLEFEKRFTTKGVFSQKNDPYEKNTSVLYLKKVRSISVTDQHDSIKIENDPLYFKKYVLLYEEQAWAALEKNLPKDFTEFLMNETSFEEVKLSKNKPYMLLYEIAHKLPFFKINTHRFGNIEISNLFVTSSDQEKETYDWICSLPNNNDEIVSVVENKIDGSAYV